MKGTLLSTLVLVALVMPSFAAGQEVTSPPEGEASITLCAVCYKDREVQFSLFYSFSNHPTNGGFGGGLGLDYFFHRYVGIGMEGNWFPGGEKDAVITQIIGNVTLRYPFELDAGRFSIAPYLFAGGGGLWDSTRSAGKVTSAAASTGVSMSTGVCLPIFVTHGRLTRVRVRTSS